MYYSKEENKWETKEGGVPIGVEFELVEKA